MQRRRVELLTAIQKAQLDQDTEPHHLTTQLVHELRGSPEPGFAELIERVSPCDLLLIEGFKREKVPKLEVYRASVGEAMLYPQDPSIIAIATDKRLDVPLPQFDLDDDPAIAAFVLKHVGLPGKTP